MDEYNPEAPNDKVYKYTCRANDYFERQLYTEAIQDYSRAITAIAETDDTHFAALLHSNRSASYFKLKNWEQAEKDAAETIRLEPTWAKGYFRQAEALAQREQYEKAIDMYKTALEKEPHNMEISSRIAKILIDKDNTNMGFQVLQLIPGRDICIERSIKNPIQNRIYEFAQIMRNIIYVIVDTDTKHCIVVDACWDVDGILKFIHDQGYTLVSAVVTHYHFDHVGGSPPPPYDNIPIKVSGLATLLKRLPHIKAYVHPLDIPYIAQANPSIPANRLVPTFTEVTETMNVGKRTKVRFIHTPGHSPGSQALLINRSRLVVGDTLLCGLCGRTDLPGGDRRMMEKTLRHTLGSLDDRVVVYPGHDYGYEWSTIGIEREKGCLGEDLVGFDPRPTDSEKGARPGVQKRRSMLSTLGANLKNKDKGHWFFNG
ncbi:beta-lactamase-like protein [Umbelopsis sp. AD052]|nr:beta-lactamase-like protein [Umbelopsis sp. AD052]